MNTPSAKKLDGRCTPSDDELNFAREVLDANVALTNRHRHRVKLYASQESVAALCFIVHSRTVKNHGHTGGTSCSANEQTRML